MIDVCGACEQCTALDDSVGLFEVSLRDGQPGSYSGPVDFVLGSSLDLAIRMSQGCNSCRSILSARDPAELQQAYGDIYTISAHLVRGQPRLHFVYGNLADATASMDGPARRAGAIASTLRTTMLHSMTRTSPAEPRARPFDLHAVNADLIRRWISRCDAHHASTCTGTYDLFLLPQASKLSFIDVTDRCIVTPEERPARYVALSYVWGTRPVPVATRAAMSSLRVPGAFAAGGPVTLPRTIDDAMRLCAALGMRFLWVDSMCIVQDDVESKMEQINAMASLYGNAYFTLAAIGSDDAEAGICRVGQSPAPPSMSSPFMHLPSHTLLGQGAGPSTLGLDVFRGKKWSSRAWTLQELAFSKRVLGLGNVATWICRGAQWTEEVEFPSEVEGNVALPDEPPGTLGITVWPSLNHYGNLAENYARRDLTMSRDTLNAFSGIVTPMSQWFPGGILFGTPEYVFDLSLLWEYRREPARPRCGHGWDDQHHEFPSWSWISWQGSSLYTRWFEDYAYPKPPIIVSPLAKWEKRSVKKGEWTKIDNSYHVVRKHFENPSTPIPDGWVKHGGGDGSNEAGVYFQHPSHAHVTPHPKFCYPIPPFRRYRDINQEPYYPYIRYTGLTTSVTFRFIGTSDERDKLEADVRAHGATPEMDIIMGDGTWGGRIRLNLATGSALPARQLCVLIALSEATTMLKTTDWARFLFSETTGRDELRGIDRYDCVNVLWIGWRKDGMAYRHGLGRVWKPAWERIQSRIDHLTCLLT